MRRLGFAAAAAVAVVLVGWAWITAGSDDHRAGLPQLRGHVVDAEASQSSAGLILRHSQTSFSGTETIVRLQVDDTSPALEGIARPTCGIPMTGAIESDDPLVEARAVRSDGPAFHEGLDLRLPPMGTGESVELVLRAVDIYGDREAATVEGAWEFTVQAPPEAEAGDELRTERSGPFELEIHGHPIDVWVIRTATNTIVYYEVPERFVEAGTPMLIDAGGGKHSPSRSGGMKPEAVFTATPFGTPMDIRFGGYFDLGDGEPLSMRIALGQAMARAGVSRDDLGEPFPLLPEDQLTPGAPAVTSAAFIQANTRPPQPDRVTVTIEGSFLPGARGEETGHRILDGSDEPMQVRFIGTGPHETEIAAQLEPETDLSTLTIVLAAEDAALREETFTLEVRP